MQVTSQNHLGLRATISWCARWRHGVARGTLLRILAAVVSFLVVLPVSFADLPGSVLGQRGFGQQAQSAADAAYNALAGLATKGETVRGGSGPLINIALSSGELICNSWIIMIRLKSKELTLRTPGLDGEDLDRTLDAIRKLDQLASIVERECTEKRLIGDGPVDGGQVTGGGATDTPGGGSSEGATGGYVKPEPLPGETVADFNCRRRCQNEYQRWQSEADRAQRWSSIAAEKQQKADALDQSLTEGRQSLSDARAQLQAMRASGPPAVTGSPTNAQVREMTNYNNRRNALDANIKSYEVALRDLAPRVERAKSDADNWQRSAREQRQRALQAKSEYDECMRRCLSFAQSIGERTTVVIEQVAPQSGDNPFDRQAPTGRVTGTPPQTPGTPAPQQGCTTPAPPSESQSQACPAGQVGSITQTRVYSCVGTAWVLGAPTQSSNTCTTPVAGCATNFSNASFACSGSCGFNSLMLNVMPGSGSMTATFGSASNAGFNCSGATATSQSSNLTILGAPGHRCTLDSPPGSPVGTTGATVNVRCQNVLTGGSCTSACSK